MIDGLIAGKLHGNAKEGTGKAGTPYVTAKVRAATGDGEPVVVNVIAFEASVRRVLLALDEGDSLALSGSLTPKVWTQHDGTTRPALDMVAHTITTAYHVRRKRQAVRDDGET